MSTSKHGSNRNALIVLGMHRSGTSALTGVLVKLGAAAPKTLMPPTPENPKGYWESSALMRLNDEILASGGSRWDDWERFNPEWIDSMEGDRVLSRIPELIESEYGDSSLFVIKDPRICRLLPAWLRALDDMGVQSKIVVPFRHPLEVGRSLVARDGMPQSQAILIWLRHVLDAEKASRGLNRAFLAYPDLLRDWRHQIETLAQRLDIKWPRWSGAVQAEIESYLATELRHHAIADDSFPQSSLIYKWAKAIHGSLCQLAAGGESEEDARRTFDSVRGECDHVLEAHAPFVHDLRVALESKVSLARSELLDVKSQLQKLNQELARSRQEVAANDARSADYEARLVDMKQQLSMAEREFAELKQSHETAIEDLKQAHRAAVADLGSTLNSQIRDLTDARQSLEEVAQERSVEICLLSKRVVDMQDAAAAHATSLQECRRALDQANAATNTVRREAAAQEQRLMQRIEMQKEVEHGLRRELDVIAGLLAHLRATVAEQRGRPAWRIMRRLTGTDPLELGSVGSNMSDMSDEERIRKSGLFDTSWYLRRYPDVKASRMDPVLHYLKHGAGEGRDPGPVSSTRGYGQRNPDVIEAGINPLVHYILYGRREGRSIGMLRKEGGRES